MSHESLPNHRLPPKPIRPRCSFCLGQFLDIKKGNTMKVSKSMIYLITYLLNIIDYIFTSYWVHNFGLSIEANPIGRWILETVPKQICFKLILPAICLLILYLFRNHKLAKIFTYIALIIYILIVTYHIFIYTNIPPSLLTNTKTVFFPKIFHLYM